MGPPLEVKTPPIPHQQITLAQRCSCFPHPDRHCKRRFNYTLRNWPHLLRFFPAWRILTLCGARLHTKREFNEKRPDSLQTIVTIALFLCSNTLPLSGLAVIPMHQLLPFVRTKTANKCQLYIHHQREIINSPFCIFMNCEILDYQYFRMHAHLVARKVLEGYISLLKHGWIRHRVIYSKDFSFI